MQYNDVLVQGKLVTQLPASAVPAAAAMRQQLRTP